MIVSLLKYNEIFLLVWKIAVGTLSVLGTGGNVCLAQYILRQPGIFFLEPR